MELNDSRNHLFVPTQVESAERVSDPNEKDKWSVIQLLVDHLVPLDRTRFFCALRAAACVSVETILFRRLLMTLASAGVAPWVRVMDSLDRGYVRFQVYQYDELTRADIVWIDAIPIQTRMFFVDCIRMHPEWTTWLDLPALLCLMVEYMEESVMQWVDQHVYAWGLSEMGRSGRHRLCRYIRAYFEQAEVYVSSWLTLRHTSGESALGNNASLHA
jgi:hypothetical protein